MLAASVMLFSLVALITCSGPEHVAHHHDAETPDAGPTPIPCAGRGSTLDDLIVAESNGVELKLVQTEPLPPIAGDNLWIVEITTSGEPVSGTLSVTPFMPDHQHGSPVSVGVVEEAPGRYRLSPLNLFMPGYWEVRLQTEHDEQAIIFELAVCVE